MSAAPHIGSNNNPNQIPIQMGIRLLIPRGTYNTRFRMSVRFELGNIFHRVTSISAQTPKNMPCILSTPLTRSPCRRRVWSVQRVDNVSMLPSVSRRYGDLYHWPLVTARVRLPSAVPCWYAGMLETCGKVESEQRQT